MYGEDGGERGVRGCLLYTSSVGNPVDAGNAGSNRKLVESSLLVKSDIVMTPEGAVQSYTLESKEGLGEPLEKFLDNNITHWRFKPVEVDGKVVTAKAPMSLRLIANREEGGGMSVRIAGTWFGRNANPSNGNQNGKPAIDTSTMRSNKLIPPMYPSSALPVSYTHLDVYKRQHPDSSCRW